MAGTVLSIAVVTCRRPAMFTRALASVASQVSDGCEIVVIDDGGEADPPPLGGVSARLIRTGCVGRAAARNAAITTATGRWVMFVDDDDEIAPGLVERLLAIIADAPPGPGVAIVSRLILDHDDDGHVFQVRERRFAPPATTARRDRMRCAVQSGLMGVAVNREAVAAAGVLDPRLSCIEDTEWLYRLTYHGAAVDVVTEPLAIVHNHRGLDRSTHPLRFRERARELRLLTEICPAMLAAEPEIAADIAAMAAGFERRGALADRGILAFPGLPLPPP